jgi:cytochrome c-type biogenesis protein CcmF
MAWRRVTAARLGQLLFAPILAATAMLVLLIAVGGVAERPLALIMFCFAAFVIAVVVQEFSRGIRVRRAMSDDSVPRALITLVRRNRRRYGGYIVHAGIALLFVGIAASTAFQDVRDASLAPGQRATVAGYEVTYVRPTGKLELTGGGTLEKISLGAQLRVSRNGGPERTLSPARAYFPSNDPTAGPLSRYFNGDVTSEVGLQSGLRRDFWTVVAPDLRHLEAIARRGDAVFTRADSLPRDERAAALGLALRRMVALYRRETAPANFRILVSPLVTWIWLGALIVFTGGLISLWPVPAGAGRRVAAAYSARLARELGRA